MGKVCFDKKEFIRKLKDKTGGDRVIWRSGDKEIGSFGGPVRHVIG
jgi:hypothetical protein